MNLSVKLVVSSTVLSAGTGIYIREGVNIRELCPDEIREKWPNNDVGVLDVTHKDESYLSVCREYSDGVIVVVGWCVYYLLYGTYSDGMFI